MSLNTLAQAFSYAANLVLVLYCAFLLLVIGYGLDAHVMMGVGRIGPDESRRLLAAMADEDEIQQRLAMSIMINLRISLAAWWSIAAVSAYGLTVPFSNRATVHLLGFLVNAATGVVHLYHMGVLPPKGLLELDPLVPTNDPYHRIPLPFDWPVALINLAAFIVVVSTSPSATTTSRAKTE